ncbi:hypothetical protein [Pseudomonas sp. 30_B]|uniref:hypothetical protein n=1 Tax=Pseudomonas sp. 30_B TaxID=2813575 RepID=UPI001A9F39BB|nr:hypothetical protein [Pseudomonas sp. 30_B]
MIYVSATQRFGGRKWTAGITKHFRNAFQGPGLSFLTRYFLSLRNSHDRNRSENDQFTQGTKGNFLPVKGVPVASMELCQIREKRGFQRRQEKVECSR